MILLGIGASFFLTQAILLEYIMASYVMTYSSHDRNPAGKRDAERSLNQAASMLTRNGEGKTMYAKIEVKRGDYQVNIYRR